MGIDACRGGWAVAYEEGQVLHLDIWENLQGLLAPEVERVCIDMPIGLHPLRRLDQQLRSLLKPIRHQSVFSVPLREAVYSSTYEKAKAINKEHTGKSISIQSWNICHRIKELDQFLSQYHRPQIIYECHPEWCFFKLNNNQHLQHKKSIQEGVSERLKLLTKIDGRVEKLFFNTMKKTKRARVKADDILDALCLYLSSRSNMNIINNDPITDEQGRLMRIAYPQGV